MSNWNMWDSELQEKCVDCVCLYIGEYCSWKEVKGVDVWNDGGHIHCNLCYSISVILLGGEEVGNIWWYLERLKMLLSMLNMMTAIQGSVSCDEISWIHGLMRSHLPCVANIAEEIFPARRMRMKFVPCAWSSLRSCVRTTQAHHHQQHHQHQLQQLIRHLHITLAQGCIMVSQKPAIKHTMRAAFVTGLSFSTLLFSLLVSYSIVGGSGFVGQVLIGDLKKLGVEVYALARSCMYTGYENFSDVQLVLAPFLSLP